MAHKHGNNVIISPVNHLLILQFALILSQSIMNLKDLIPFGESNNQNQSCFPQLGYTERLIGFAICFALGYFIQILSFGSFLSVITGSPAKFAIIYSIGNIISIVGTGFLIGFKRQLENMVDKERRYTSMIFLGALIGTLVSAILFQSRLLVFLFLLVQIPAYIWYTASYIPFARDCIKNCIRGCFRRN